MFSLAQKGTQKGHSNCAGPSGYLAFLSVAGTVKNSPAYSGLKQFYRLVPATAAILSGTEWVHNPKTLFFCLFTQPSSTAKNGLATRRSPTQSNQENGCLFWFVFGQAK